MQKKGILYASSPRRETAGTTTSMQFGKGDLRCEIQSELCDELSHLGTDFAGRPACALGSQEVPMVKNLLAMRETQV